ncbi:acyl-CoA thioester hydrolase [Sphingomonas palmae]|uniref:Acyl-CoA thioester hydrolase n=1 Tax=Sphingomonas palmae TaxID=1855283 RepID=A0A1H7LZ53_9SPHN|nr:thioesterase family protein [Sphingomonas palmae]SEL04214.1 acyl-CoA thioester hydrolase [Sphingomonas palmae]
MRATPLLTRPGFAFSTLFKVRYAEIDGQKIVFNSRYLEYADVAVTEFWDWTGIAEAVEEWRHTEFNVRRAELDYLAPFRLGDEVEAFVRIEKLGTTSITKRFELANPATGTLCCAITMVSVHVDLASGRPVPLPPAIRTYLERLPTGVS